MPIVLPKVDPKRELARKLVESVVSQIPFVGGPFVALLSVTRRPDAEKKIEFWRQQVTASVNSMEQAITDLLPTIKLSSDASVLGHWISENSKHGRTDSVDFEAIRSAFPSATKLELEDACGELELDNLATTQGAMGHKIALVRPTILLFEVFDPIVFEGANPRVDAAHLAGFILENDQGVNASTILDHFGWNVRRFNPAISILCTMVAEGRRSAEIHPELACRYIMPNSAERARFKRYADSVLGSSN